MADKATGEERVGQSVVKGAHWLINDLWVPEQKAFRYTSCPKTFVHPWSNFLLFDGIVYAHKLSGDAKLREVLLEGTDSALELVNAQVDLDSENPWDKMFTQYTRITPHIIEHLARLKESGQG